VVGTTLVITESSRFINKAPDQNRVLDGGLTETKAIDNLAYAIKVAKSLNAAVGNMCPRCLSVISEALPSQQDRAAIPGGQKDK
jgi:hypothetical protein